MSWGLIDDQSTFHPKVVAAGNGAWGACLRMVAWSMAHLTDGKVPAHIAKLIASDEEIELLIRNRLAHPTSEGFEIHDFLEWNKSSRQIRKDRAAKQKAGKSGGLASGKRRKQTAIQAGADASASGSRLVERTLNPSPSPSPSPLRSYKEDPPIPPKGGVARQREPLILIPDPPSQPEASEADQVYVAYVAARRKHNPRSRPPPKPEPKERKALAELLRTGTTVEDLKLACEGMFLSPHHLGENDRNTPYLAFGFVLRPKNLATFIDLALQHKPTSTRPVEAPAKDPQSNPASVEEIEAFRRRVMAPPSDPLEAKIEQWKAGKVSAKDVLPPVRSGPLPGTPEFEARVAAYEIQLEANLAKLKSNRGQA